MRLEEMLGAPEAPVDTNVSSIPGQMTVEECIAEGEQPQFETATTPNGMEVYYQWAPKRLYRLRNTRPGEGNESIECPSVTTVLNVLDKSGALTWWGMKVGIDGLCALLDKGTIDTSFDIFVGGEGTEYHGIPLGTDSLVELLTEHRLTVNHVKDKAADRGINVHDALESWCKHGVLPIVEQYPEAERGYIDGLCAFLTAIRNVAEVDGMEVMVGSLEHLYAGRFDLVLNISQPVEVVTKCYPKRADKMQEIPAGRYLLDLKTSKRVYPTHFLQLEAYEKASVECGYQPTDHRGVVHVTADGKYELALNTEWQFEDFLAVRNVYTVMNEREQLRNEREIESALRTELGAKDVA